MPLDPPNSQPSIAPPLFGLQPRAVDLVPAPGLIVDRAILDEILAHLRASLPAEGCGLLASVRDDGASQPGGAERAISFYPGTNIDDSATRYTMDPVEVLAALRDMEAHGWRLGAIVHSHPTSPPTPSPTDLREAHYQGALMVIVSFAGSEPVARAWAIDLTATPPARPFREAPLVVEEPSAS